MERQEKQNADKMENYRNEKPVGVKNSVTLLEIGFYRYDKAK